MTKLVELNNKTHGDLKVVKNCALAIAKQQHLINLRVIEVAKAVCCFPVFLTKLSDTEDWAVSAVTSLEMNKNVFVNDDSWDAIYHPVGMQTYPFFLMERPSAEKGYSVGILEGDAAFSTEQGEPIFDDSGQPTDYLSQISALLDDEVKNIIHTHQFLQEMDTQGLIKAVDVSVRYADGTINNLQGLHTLDEEKLKALDAEKFVEISKKGYLPAIYAMLISIYQFNELIKRHNQTEGANKMVQVKMEPPKDTAAA